MKICTNFLNLLKVCMCVALAFAALETRAQGGLYGIGYRQGCFRAAGDRSYGLDTTTQKEM
ncbi:MAG: hypothetical protein ACLRMJ_11410 [Alistipes finegoldii]